MEKLKEFFQDHKKIIIIVAVLVIMASVLIAFEKL